MPFSCRKRITQTVKNQPILRAKRSAATAGWASWRLTLACWRHERTTPAQNHACITSADQNHAQHTITQCTTGKQHHEPSNHASTTGECTTSLAQPAFPNRDRLITIKKQGDHATPAAQRIAIQPRRTIRSMLHSSRS
jgi:hypothetical protein